MDGWVIGSSQVWYRQWLLVAIQLHVSLTQITVTPQDEAGEGEKPKATKKEKAEEGETKKEEGRGDGKAGKGGKEEGGKDGGKK